MKILGIETSCDETAASVVEDGVRILSNVVVSQIDIFAEYGGVIPEVAARSHLEVILPVIDKALSDAACTWDDIDAIAVTHAPGLLGSLLIGTLTARTLAILHDKPLYAVHHLKSHIYANWLATNEFENAPLRNAPSLPSLRGSVAPHFPRREICSSEERFSNSCEPQFPLLALVVSGGHTQILYMRGHNQFEIIGTTHDDAVGECFDKVAKILGLPYPGGPAISKAAEGEISMFHSGPRPASPSPRVAGAHPRAAALRKSPNQNIDISPDATRYHFPHPKVEGLDFSFSGLKTAVLRAVQKEVGVPISYPSHKLKELLTPRQVCDFAASFQKTAVDILCEKMRLALEQYPDVKSVVAAGGVSANEVLRREMSKSCLGPRPSGPSPRADGAHPRAAALRKSPSQDLDISFPQPHLSGDNGAMVAAACYFEIQSGVKPTDPYSLNIYPRISIEN